MGSYDTETDDGTDLRRRVLDLEARLLDLESALRTQRRMVAPVCLITAGLVLAFASFGLVRDGAQGTELLGGWAALFLVYLLLLVPLTALTVASRSPGMRGAAVVAWTLTGLMAVCMGAGPRGALAAALGIAPWYLLGAGVITIVGLVRLPTSTTE